jgi:hypothetical protein
MGWRPAGKSYSAAAAEVEAVEVLGVLIFYMLRIFYTGFNAGSADMR